MFIGIVFIVVWLALAGVWFLMSFMAGAMANDSGSVASEIHGRMLILLLLGELVVAIAGVLGGSSFIFQSHGPFLWKAFWILLAVGVVMQVVAVVRFLMAA